MSRAQVLQVLWPKAAYSSRQRTVQAAGEHLSPVVCCLGSALCCGKLLPAAASLSFVSVSFTTPLSLVNRAKFLYCQVAMDVTVSMAVLIVETDAQKYGK